MRLSTDVADVAQRLRIAYIEERTAQLRRMAKDKHLVWKLPASFDQKDRANKTVWSRAASKVIQHKLIPELLVGIVFRTVTLAGKSAPLPNMLTSDWFIGQYRKQYPVVDEQEASLQLRMETEIFRRKIACLLERRGTRTLVEIRRAALVDDQITCSPLFRFCAARSEKIEDIAEDYSALAAVQFTPSAEAYKAAWGEFIPQDFIKYWVGEGV